MTVYRLMHDPKIRFILLLLVLALVLAACDDPLPDRNWGEF